MSEKISAMRVNLCEEHAKGLLFLVTSFGWSGYRTYSVHSEETLGWLTGCDYGRTDDEVRCNRSAEYLYEN